MKNKLLYLVLTTLLFICIMPVFYSCTNNNTSDKPIVAVSILPEKAFVEAVCGDKVEVITMIPKGASPENYEPSYKEMIGLSDAIVYFGIGVPSEQNNILSKGLCKNVVKLDSEVENVFPARYIGNEKDPHIWLSIKRVIKIIDVIKDTMIGLDGDNADFYKINASNYVRQLLALDEELSGTLNELEQKNIIVFHPAFGYLCDDYGLTMYSLEKDGKEATAKDIRDMVDFAKSENIKVIFYQQEMDSKQAVSFANSIDGVAVMLSPLAENYIDNYSNMINKIKEWLGSI